MELMKISPSENCTSIHLILCDVWFFVVCFGDFLVWFGFGFVVVFFFNLGNSVQIRIL